MSDELNFIHPTHVPIFSILRLSVPELWVTQYDHITITWNGHCACAVSRDLSPGGKNDLHFWNPWPQFVYWLCHIQGTTTKSTPCYRRKIAFSHCERYKVYCACAVSRDLCIGDPPKPHVTIFDPELSIHYTTYMGLRRLFNGSFILEHPHVEAVFGRKKLKSSQNRSQKWRFFGNKRVSILIVVIGTPKRHILGRNDVFWRIFSENTFTGLGCSELQVPKKR